MRPTRLTMKAFGSYAGKTPVEFGDLTGGLYLIVGKTGAGKTTIFDAISFALFGVPSGSERRTEMLHSDYVPLSEDTEVTLDFVHQGRAYHVERSLHFSKKRGAEGYGEAKVSAVMSGPEQPAIEGATRVTAHCEELLGLNSEQFRRIVMLAQGEFREFLKAGSDKKNEILGRLFDNSEYLRFQELLASAAKRLEQQRQGYRAEIDTVMNTLFKMPEGPAEPEAEGYLPGHPRLAENLRELVRREEERLETLKAESEKLSRAVQELTRREGAAETDNALLDELDAQRAALVSLEGQREAFAARKEAYLAAEKALHRVKPRELEADRAAAALERTQGETARQEALLEEQSAALIAAQAIAEADGPKRTGAEALSGEAAKLADAFPRYGQAAEKEAESAGTRRKLDIARESVKTIEEQETTLAKALTAIREELGTLEGCEAEAVRLATERDAAKERSDAVSAPEDGIAARVDAIHAEEGALDAEEGALAQLTREAAEADERRHALYQAFLEGQAGLIAASMEKELAEAGKTVCPVCGTAFCREEAHRFALPAQRVPEKAAVDGAERAAKTAEDKRQKKQAELEKRRSLLEQRKDAVAGQARKLAPECSGWGTLVSPGWLPALRDRLEQALTEKENACTDAQAKCSRRKRLLDQEKAKAAEQETLEKRLGEEKSRCGELEQDLRGLSGAVEEIRRQLPYPTEAEARARHAELMRDRLALLSQIDAHEKALSAAKEALDRTKGGLRTLYDALPEQKRAAETAKDLLRQAVAENGFADISAVQAALSPIGSADGEQWLLREKEAQDGYSHDLANTGKRIEELAAQTAGKLRVDLSELRSQLAEVSDARSAAGDAVTAQAGLLEGHRTVAARVEAAKASLAGTDRAFRRISRLADLAIGTNSEGGKLSFDRYVMGAIFREVLEMANRRLNIMTGGRFELIHSVDAGRKNAVAGLEIEVLDVAVGKQRASGSISGGEGFMVSLALALGLSDVVQSHAGGQKLDTLFIDEGFGTLDDGKLDNVISVLQQLTEGNRLVGIISHVDKLEESIPQKLRVTSTERGSTLALELS